MKNKFICYPKCSTCKKARDYLIKNHIDFDAYDITLHVPTQLELKEYIKLSGLPVKRFFNTSGLVYRSLELKNKIDYMSEKELIKLLSTNGMLIKRPILVTTSKVLVGFNESEYKKII